MRKVFLDDLPRKGKVIDWVESVRHSVRFIYDDIDGVVNVKGYDGKYLTIEYNLSMFKIFTGTFTKASLGRILKKHTNEFKLSVNDRLFDSKRDISIIDREYRIRYDKNNRKYNDKWYRYICNNCGYKSWRVETSMLIGQGCPCCNGRVVVVGVNTLWDTNRWVCNIGVSEVDAKKYTKSSDSKIEVICPYCNRKKIMRVEQITRSKSICCTCGDGFSYPEKFMYNVLKQLGVEFETQYNPKWTHGKIYDFYIPSLNMIIETHGIQHYEESPRGRLLKEEQKNDKVKKDLALSNGIKYYIELDCRKSDLEWIKNSIIHSNLNLLFDFLHIDWLKSEEYAINSNKVKEVCDCWNSKSENHSVKYVSESIGIGKWCVRKYLSIGNRLGWCKYDGKDEEQRQIEIKSYAVKVIINGIVDRVFKSVSELERQSKVVYGTSLSKTCIHRACKSQKTYKGFTFQYI